MPKKKSKQQPVEVDYAIVCEDIRKEHNNKMMLSGIYTGAILVAGFPAVLRLALWFHAKAKVPGQYDLQIKLQITSQSDKPVTSIGKMSITASENPLGNEAGFGVQGVLVNFKGPGTFTVYCRIGGTSAWKKMLEKAVSLLPNEQPQLS